MIQLNLAKLTNSFRYINWVRFAQAHWQEVLAALVICISAGHALGAVVLAAL